MNTGTIPEYRPVAHPDFVGTPFVVSNLGDFQNARTGNSYTLGPRGRVFVNKRFYFVGRLVALTFLAEPGVDYTKQRVFHRDGDNFNNRVENLYWK